VKYSSSDYTLLLRRNQGIGTICPEFPSGSRFYRCAMRVAKQFSVWYNKNTEKRGGWYAK
jgi:hypothetical protein